MITEQGLLSKYVSVSDVEEGSSIKSSLKFDYFSSKEIREISDSTDIVLNCSVWDTYGPNGVGKKVVKSW